MKPDLWLDLWLDLFKAVLGSGVSADEAEQIANRALVIVEQRRGVGSKLQALLRAVDALGSVSGPEKDGALCVPRHLIWPVFEAANAVKEATKP